MESTVIIQMKGNDGLSQRNKCRGGEDWSDPGHSLKVEWTAFPKGLDMKYGGNRRILDD